MPKITADPNSDTLISDLAAQFDNLTAEDLFDAAFLYATPSEDAIYALAAQTEGR